MIGRLRFSEREKWLVAAAVAAALFFFLADVYLLPYWDSLGERAEKIEIDSKRVGSYRRILHGQDSVKAALETVKQQTATIENGLLENRSDALATAEMQGLVKEMVLSKGLTLARSDLQPVKSLSADYSRVSTRVELAGSIDQFVSLMVRIETGEKILSVDEVRLVPASPGNPKNKNVVVSLVISALKWSEPGPEAAAKRS
jgi:Tfp pilus assembly protein PilO